MAKRIALVTLDTSMFSRNIVPYLQQVLDPETFRCVLLHVAAPTHGLTAMPPRPVSLAWPRPLYGANHDVTYAQHPIYDIQQEESVRAEVERTLLTVQHQLEDAGFTASIEVRFGEPAEEIVAAAQQHQANIIAMATHNRAGLRQIVLGSVAEQVLRNASVPVLLVGPAALRHERALR